MKHLMITVSLVAALSVAAAITTPESGQPVVVPANETWTVESEDDIATLNAAGEAVVSDGATLKFVACSQNLAATTRLSGPGTVEFDYNGTSLTENLKFKAQWDGTGLSGCVIVRSESSLEVFSNTCFGSAKVIAYAGAVQGQGAIDFNAGTYDLDNAFELHGKNYQIALRAPASDVTLRGPVSAFVENSQNEAVRLNALSFSHQTLGSIRLLGDVNAQCRLYASMNNNNDIGSNASGRPLVVYGNGTTNTVLDLGGFALNSDCNKGTNVLACAVTNGYVRLTTGNRWRLDVDDPFRTTKDAVSGFSWGDVMGGWVDLNGHHLLAGQWQYGNRWEGGWGLALTENEVRGGGFRNGDVRFATLLFRTAMGGCTADKHVRLQMEDNLNVVYDGHFAAGATDESNDYDFNGTWSCWLGNYPNASSSLCGSLTAARGALHLASSANYPNVARLIAQDTGAVYVHKGAQVNPNVALCVEGNGRIYLAQDITVANLYTNGVLVAKEAGAYTTDDFDFLFANDDMTQGSAEDKSFKVTVTGNRPPVARVGTVCYASFADAVADAQGGVIELLADVTFTPTLDFKAKTGDFTLTEDTSAAFTGYRRTVGPDADGVTTYVFRARPTFAGGSGEFHKIAAAEDVREIAYWMAQGETFSGHVFSLTADIDWDAAQDGAFDGIGSATDAAVAFKGTFDGGGRTIRNLVLSRTATGLFNRVDGGLVQNLTLDTVSFAAGEGPCGGAAFVGTLTNGKAIGLTLRGAFGTVNVPLTAAAGIVADATNAAIDVCTNEATMVVVDGGSAAGILGRAAGGTITSVGGCRAPAGLKSVGRIESVATCTDLALAMVEGAWADILVPEQPLAGVNEYRLMSDLVRDFELTGTDSGDSALILDLTLGTQYRGRVSRNGVKLGRTVLDNPPRLKFDRRFGIAVIIR